eukprot:COSAG01_NODE_1381_length_10520_cov_2.661710_2_plen_116_part_00
MRMRLILLFAAGGASALYESIVFCKTMRGEYWDANRALLRPRNVYPIILLHPHVTPKTGMVTYVPEEVSTGIGTTVCEPHPCCHSISLLLLLLASHSPLSALPRFRHTSTLLADA